MSLVHHHCLKKRIGTIDRYNFTLIKVSPLEMVCDELTSIELKKSKATSIGLQKSILIMSVTVRSAEDNDFCIEKEMTIDTNFISTAEQSSVTSNCSVLCPIR